LPDGLEYAIFYVYHYDKEIVLPKTMKYMYYHDDTYKYLNDIIKKNPNVIIKYNNTDDFNEDTHEEKKYGKLVVNSIHIPFETNYISDCIFIKINEEISRKFKTKIDINDFDFSCYEISIDDKFNYKIQKIIVFLETTKIIITIHSRLTYNHKEKKKYDSELKYITNCVISNEIVIYNYNQNTNKYDHIISNLNNESYENTIIMFDYL